MMRLLLASMIAAAAAWSAGCRQRPAAEASSVAPASAAVRVAVTAPPAAPRSCAPLPPGMDSAADRVWWDTIRLLPRDSSLAGLPASAIDSTWLLVSGLCASSVPPDSSDPVADSDFAVGGDFNEDGRHDSAVVGVFQRKSGTIGSFLLILTRDGPTWRNAYLVVDSGGGRYSSVSADRKGKRITWWFCRECDFSADIVWKDGRYQPREETPDSSE